jgi:hypothetical protein
MYILGTNEHTVYLNTHEENFVLYLLYKTNVFQPYFNTLRLKKWTNSALKLSAFMRHIFYIDSIMKKFFVLFF